MASGKQLVRLGSPTRQLRNSGMQICDATITDKLQGWQSNQASTPSDMLEDSCWTDLPDLDLNDSSGLQSELFAKDACQVASSPNDIVPSMFDTHEADLLLPERLDNTLFTDHSESLADMNLESILADHDCMLRLTPDKQLQPKTPSASSNHLDDFLQQLYPSRFCSPVSRDTEQQGTSQESAAAPIQDLRMVAAAPARALVEDSHCLLSSQAETTITEQIHAVSTAKQEMAKKHPKIIVRLNMSAGKKKSSKAAQGRTSSRLADKHPGGRQDSLTVATKHSSAEKLHQLVVHKPARKSSSQDVGTQTDSPAESSSCNLHLEHPFLSANSAEALAEGTRLLMAAPRGTFTQQHITQLSAGLRAAPWTLLTRSNIQLRLKPMVAATGTQTEDLHHRDEPSTSTIARIDIAPARRDTSQELTKSASVLAAQLATSRAAQPRPSQTFFATGLSMPPAISAAKTKTGACKMLSPPRAARNASYHRLSPNAHLMFQCQVGALPYATFAPPWPLNSPKHQLADCSTPARIREQKYRLSSVSCVSPASTTHVAQPAADAASEHPGLGQAAVTAAEPLEIQLSDAGRTTLSCKSAGSSPSPLSSASGPVEQWEPSLRAQALSGINSNACLRCLPQTAQEPALLNACAFSTGKPANISSPTPSRKTDTNNSKASAAGSAAAGPKASHETPGSKAAAAVDPVLTDATTTVSNSPDSMQANGLDSPVSAQEPAQRHGQPTSQLASASPKQAASHPSVLPAMLGRTASAPEAPRATSPIPPLVPLAAGALQDQHHTAAAASASRPAPRLTPCSSPHKATACGQQGKQHNMPPLAATEGTPKASTNPTAAAVAAACPKAVMHSEPTPATQVRTRGKSQSVAEGKQLGSPSPSTSPSTADALRTDLVSTAGCHVTRRLVQHLLEPVQQPAKACSKPARGAAAHSVAQPPACKGKGRAVGQGQATQAGRGILAGAAASGSNAGGVSYSQPPQANKASAALASTKSKGKVSNADQSKQAGKDKHRPSDSKAVAIKERQQSTPPLPLPADKATKSKATTQKATDVKLGAKHASHPKAGKTRSILEPQQQMSATATAINSVTDNKKTGTSTAASEQQTAAVNVVNSSTADKEKACISKNVIGPGASRPAAVIEPGGSVSRSKELQPSYTSDSQAQSGLKRLRSDASAASVPAKKHKSTCLTAAGLNPKFMATKDEVLRLIGDREGVLEAELRRSMGNNPDTSKAVRKLHKEGALQRSGAGGRPDPFKWTKMSQSHS